MNEQLLRHIAIIMDGNGRWAEKHGLPRIAGHREGVKTVKKIIEVCLELGIKYLTLYVFSTENWKRPDREVNALMSLLTEHIRKRKQELVNRDIKVSFIGKLKKLPEDTFRELKRIESMTSKNKSLDLILAINYGSRDEIITAVKKIAKKVKSDELKIEHIDDKVFQKFLFTSEKPDPDILIRTAGEYRISNFLLWQLSYSEIFISQKCWPDFDEQDLKSIIEQFKHRNRKFGGINE